MSGLEQMMAEWDERAAALEARLDALEARLEAQEVAREEFAARLTADVGWASVN